MTRAPATHFIGFKRDEYRRAVRTFGAPGFIHRLWDVRARQEIQPGDRAIFANGTHPDKPPTIYSFNDSEHL